MATKPVHRLQIRPMCTTRGHPLAFPNLRPGPRRPSNVRMRRGTIRQTHIHTDCRDQYAPHAKCNYSYLPTWLKVNHDSLVDK